MADDSDIHWLMTVTPRAKNSDIQDDDRNTQQLISVRSICWWQWHPNNDDSDIKGAYEIDTKALMTVTSVHYDSEIQGTMTVTSSGWWQWHHRQYTVTLRGCWQQHPRINDSDIQQLMTGTSIHILMTVISRHYWEWHSVADDIGIQQLMKLTLRPEYSDIQGLIAVTSSS